jgi:hypothetical protein
LLCACVTVPPAAGSTTLRKSSQQIRRNLGLFNRCECRLLFGVEEGAASGAGGDVVGDDFVPDSIRDVGGAGAAGGTFDVGIGTQVEVLAGIVGDCIAGAESSAEYSGPDRTP